MAFTSTLTRLVTFDDYIHAIYQRQNFVEEADFQSIKEALREAYANPLDLNKVTAASLGALGILSIEQIKSFFNHLAATGPLYSRYELQAIPGFDLTTIDLLLPFVYVVESYHLPSHYPKINQNNYNYFLFRYAPSLSQRSCKQLPALGNLAKCMVQLTCNHLNDITWGITARKQAGEAFCWDHATYRYGFNLWSIFLMVKHKKTIKRMVIGDYQIGYGQGLLLSPGYKQLGDSITSIIWSNNLGIRPYKGIRRTGLRGLAITSDLGPIELTGFYANNHLDATIQLDQDHKPYSKRIDDTGKYDTIHQLDKKGTLHEQVLGCTIRKQYDRNQTEMGINLLYNHYDLPIVRKEAANKRYLWQKQSAGSLFYRLLWKNVLFFGEAGLTLPHIIQAKKSKAVITGSIISLSRYVDLSLALYYYGQGFYSPYGHPFKRYTTDHANEKGTYWGLIFTPLSSWQLTTSGHFFTTLSPKPQLAIPRIGHRLMTRSSYTLSRKTIWVIQYKLHNNPRNKPKVKENNQSDTTTVAMATQNSLKCKIDHQLTHYWRTHCVVQYTRYTFLGKTHDGYALSSTQKWKVNKWQFVCKFIYFNTDNYATRLYFYLPNPLYSGTQFTPYYGHGFATTWLICSWPIESVRFEIRYSFIYSPDDLSKIKSTTTSRCNRGKHDGTIQLLISF
ncbi:helix-hairpin-helix domain-containing protein [Candidatus Cardinium sp. cByotN1]|uniref:helix-hairpin-helix domain-containing protein n=1 Tax=Candidatus Cardinium sp. cByotN1 TaxID=2699439 RepID=UPI001FB31CF0|nr:helix-hairpin-helix domain-containing protein [Candidatus Cardinium sp. cByotN1]